MTPDEICNVESNGVSGYYQTFWLKEIAYQLALSNEKLALINEQLARLLVEKDETGLPASK